MSKKTWNEAVTEIRLVLDTATSDQQRLIDFLDLEISKDTPRLVVAAKLYDHLAGTIAVPPPTEPREYTLEYLETLKTGHGGNIEPRSQSEAKAWVNHLRLLQRMEHLERIKIEAGDIVEDSTEGYLAEVSSIGLDGRVFFKGGHGAGSWPDLLTVVTRRNDNSPHAERMREEARNRVAGAARIRQWSETKHRELAEYEIEDFATEDDIDHLEQVIGAASDEKPIQKHLEKNPHIITALLGGKHRYCIPQKRLGSEYVPDFLISDTDSLGINWILIELETPKSAIYLQSNDQLDKYARKGVAQIQEWKEWLTSNIAYARGRHSDNGLGLIDIRPSSQAVVIVGRRVRLRKTKEAVRYQLRDGENIHIHTYDWLLERLHGALTFNGPSGANPHLFQPNSG